MEFLTGFESTHIFGSGKDVLDTTEHTRPDGRGRYGADLMLVAETGIKTLRYSIPWHKIERTQGTYDWCWVDAAMLRIRELGLEIIADPLHHTSFPEWLTLGFADTRFVTSYVRFVLAFADRYPQVTRFTHVNEPYVTSWFCGHEGVWHPHRTGDAAFVEMILNCAEAVCQIDRALRAVKNITFLHVESCERHYAADRGNGDLTPSVLHNNERRFVVHDLISGRAKAGLPLYRWLRSNGLSEQREEWFQANPAKIDVLGLDYYRHSEIWWAADGRRIEPLMRRGFAGVACDYARRYPDCDVMLSETNLRGTPEERTAHFAWMLAECRQLEQWLSEKGREFRGFCWYPFIDSCDWDSLVTRADGHIDPQGVYSLAEDRHRVETGFTRAFRDAIGIEAQSSDLTHGLLSQKAR